MEEDGVVGRGHTHLWRGHESYVKELSASCQYTDVRDDSPPGQSGDLSLSDHQTCTTRSLVTGGDVGVANAVPHRSYVCPRCARRFVQWAELENHKVKCLQY